MITEEYAEFIADEIIQKQMDYMIFAEYRAKAKKVANKIHSLHFSNSHYINMDQRCREAEKDYDNYMLTLKAFLPEYVYFMVTRKISLIPRLDKVDTSVLDSIHQEIVAELTNPLPYEN